MFAWGKRLLHRYKLKISMKILEKVQEKYSYIRLPHLAKVECSIDRSGLPTENPGIEKSIDEAVAWLCRAQDNSLSKDGGVARHYNLLSGWSTSYPETTGYIIPTMLGYARMKKDGEIRHRTKKMLDWLVSIQLSGGGFQGGLIE